MEAFAKVFELILEKYGTSVFFLTLISLFSFLLVRHIIQSLEDERMRTSKYISDMMDANTRITAQNTVVLQTAVNSLMKLENASNYQREEHKEMLHCFKELNQLCEDINRTISLMKLK